MFNLFAGRIQLIVITSILLTLSCHAQDNKDRSQPTEPPKVVIVEAPTRVETTDDDIRNLNPTRDDKDVSKLYVPSSLEDSFVELDKMLHPKFIEDFKKAGKGGPIEEHFGLGLWMRNNWGLWGGSRLAKYFRSIEINHPDDMSGIILTSYQRKLNGLPIELDAQVKEYKDFWKKQKP